MIGRGWAMAALGRAEEGIAQIRQGLADYQDTGARENCPYEVALLVEAYLREGRTEEGLAALTDGLAGVNRRGGHTTRRSCSGLKEN
jgi:hypothetical protein